MDKNGEVVQKEGFPKRWGAERVFELTPLKLGQTIVLQRISRRTGDWKTAGERSHQKKEVV